MEQSLAPTVVESNVPERTRRRGEYGARASGRKITVSFCCPPLHSNGKNKPNLHFFGGVFTESSQHQEEGSEGFGAASFFSFFFLFFFLLLLPFSPLKKKKKEKRILCLCRGWFVLRFLAAKMMVGEVEVKERPRPSPDYLMQLLNEKKLMTSLPNLCGIFTHLERLLDEGKRQSGEVEGEGVRGGA